MHHHNGWKTFTKTSNVFLSNFVFIIPIKIHGNFIAHSTLKTLIFSKIARYLCTSLESNFSFDEPIFLCSVHTKSKLIRFNLVEKNILEKTTFRTTSELHVNRIVANENVALINENNSLAIYILQLVARRIIGVVFDHKLNALKASTHET